MAVIRLANFKTLSLLSFPVASSITSSRKLGVSNVYNP